MSSVPTESVHVALEEKILMTVGRDGGLQGLEVLGLLTLRVAEENVGRWVRRPAGAHEVVVGVFVVAMLWLWRGFGCGYASSLTMTNPRVRLELQSTTNKAIQLQTHPNIDKELFKTRSIIGLKNPAKPFPLNTGMLVLLVY